MRRVTEFLLVCAMAAGMSSAALAAEPGASVPHEKEEGKVEYGEVTGTVSAVSKQGVAVEYSRTKQGSYEMFLPIAEGIRLSRIQSLTDVKPGDTVKVGYQQTVKEDGKGKRVVLKTVATELTFLKPAQQLTSKEEAAE